MLAKTEQTKLSIYSDKFMEAGWLAAVIVVPLFFNIYSARTFEPDKITLLRSIATFMLLAWGISFFEQAGRNPLPALVIHFRHGFKTPLFLAVLGFVLVYLISTIFSLSPTVSLWGSYRRLQGSYTMLSYVVIFALIATKLRTAQQVERLVIAIILPTIPVCLNSLAQYYGISLLPSSSSYTTCFSPILIRITGMSGAPIIVALYLIMVIPITLSYSLKSLARITQKRALRWVYAGKTLIYLAILVLQIVILHLIWEILPILAFWGGILLLILLLILYLKQRHYSWRWLGWGWGILATLMIAGLLIIALKPPTWLYKDIEAEQRDRQARQLIWDSSLQLVNPHEALGITGDELASPDIFNIIRPLVGYGPESMFNAFAFVYPPRLAYVEARGSSVDRTHNETLDLMINSGVLGVVAFYFFLIILFYNTLKYLGWVPDKSATWRLFIFLGGTGLGGMVVSWLTDYEGSPLTYIGLGLPLGLLSGMFGYLIWQGFFYAVEERRQTPTREHTMLVMGLLTGLVIQLIASHFMFSISTSYLYFWVYAALLTALSTHYPSQTISSTQTLAQTAEPLPAEESWLSWTLGQVLVLLLIFTIFIFDIVTPQFEFLNNYDSEAVVFNWMIGLTVGVALGLTLAYPLTQAGWSGWRPIVGTVLLYAAVTLGGGTIYMLVHQAILGQQTVVIVLEDVIRAANVLVSGLFLLYGFLWLTLMLLALVLSWNLTTGLCFWKWENWLLYPTLTLLMLLLIYFKNINVIRADIYLKEGERYRNQRQWSQAIALHEKALFLDSDEDFYYLMLALDYQLMAQDSNLDQTQRHEAWLHSERIALQARAINPYNPDNTGHLGRYYFTLGQIFNTSYYPKALDYFDRATQLAPANIIYHNLKAKTHYIMQEYETAIEALQTSISIDPQYAPTWILLGDTHAAVGQVDQALLTHQEGLKLKAGGDGVKIFANHFFDQRLKFYISANREDQLIAVLQQLAAEQKDDPFLPWAIGHTHNMAGRPNHALPYLKQAWLMDQRYYNGVELLQELTDVYISLNLLSEAIALNEEVVQLSDWDYTAWKNLAILYYRQSNPTRALTAAQQAQKLAPSDEAAMWLEFITQLQTKPY